MSWTRVVFEVDVDGEKAAALEAAGDLLEMIANEQRVIVGVAHVEQTHRDDCDDCPCTCAQADA